MEIKFEEIKSGRSLDAIINHTGMPLDRFLKDPELCNKFRKAGLYLFSVEVAEFRTFIKLRLSKNLLSRLISHHTSLYPVEAKIFIHSLVLKRSNLVPKVNTTEEDEDKKN